MALFCRNGLQAFQEMKSDYWKRGFSDDATQRCLFPTHREYRSERKALSGVSEELNPY
jgi:hypothetical protein